MIAIHEHLAQKRFLVFQAPTQKQKLTFKCANRIGKCILVRFGRAPIAGGGFAMVWFCEKLMAAGMRARWPSIIRRDGVAVCIFGGSRFGDLRLGSTTRGRGAIESRFANNAKATHNCSLVPVIKSVCGRCSILCARKQLL